MGNDGHSVMEAVIEVLVQAIKHVSQPLELINLVSSQHSIDDTSRLERHTTEATITSTIESSIVGDIDGGDFLAFLPMDISTGVLDIVPLEEGMSRRREASGIACNERLVGVGDISELMDGPIIHKHGNTNTTDGSITPAVVVDTSQMIDVIEKALIRLASPNAAVRHLKIVVEYSPFLPPEVDDAKQETGHKVKEKSTDCYDDHPLPLFLSDSR